MIGLGGAWGPLWGQFRFVPEALFNWVKPGTYRCRPWKWVPFTAGHTRSWFDVVAYLGLLATLLVALLADGTPTTDLPDAEAGLVRPELLIAPIVLLIVLGLRDN